MGTRRGQDHHRPYFRQGAELRTPPPASPTSASSAAASRWATTWTLEIDGASNRGIDDARRLREAIAYAPMEGRYKVFIDEAHMLTRESFNALLKTLEEPPPRATFILATTEATNFRSRSSAAASISFSRPSPKPNWWPI